LKAGDSGLARGAATLLLFERVGWAGGGLLDFDVLSERSIRALVVFDRAKG
jgi:hypothetical protein